MMWQLRNDDGHRLQQGFVFKPGPGPRSTNDGCRVILRN